jgi:hypothetical protein
VCAFVFVFFHLVLCLVKCVVLFCLVTCDSSSFGLLGPGLGTLEDTLKVYILGV